MHYNASMNKLPTETRAAFLTALAEGCSMASACRMFRLAKVTALRLLADAGTLASQFHDLMVRDLECQRVQVDEIWSFVGAKQKNVGPKNWGKQLGDAWVWVGMCADTKLVINWCVGGRDTMFCRPFLQDMAQRIVNRVQLTSDGHASYRASVPGVFGNDVDFATIVKQYGTPAGQGPERRYSPGQCWGCTKEAIIGKPDEKHISTSYVERQNLTMRMSMRRFTRLTNGFSKKWQNHEHAIAVHYFSYNWVRKHQTHGMTPAQAAGLTDRRWTMYDFVKLMEEEEVRLGGRIAGSYLPATPTK